MTKMNIRPTLLKMFVLLLMITLIIATLPPIAQASGLGTFVIMDNYVEGEDVAIYWNTVSGADHYDVTVKNSTTGSYPRSRSTADSYYSCYVSGSKIKPGKHKVWVGAVDASGNVIEQDTVYFNVSELDDCDHEYSKKGYCKLCGEDCPHNNGVYEVETGSNSKSISSTKHQIVWTYDEQCKICRKVLSSNESKTETGKHQFDDNGDCTLCDYRAGCSHRETVLDEISRSYAIRDDVYHTVKTVSSKVCANANCGKVVSYGSEIDSFKEHHDMQSDGCTLCGYAEVYDPLEVSVSRNQSSAQAGDTIGAKASVTGGSGSYKYVWYAYRDGSEVMASSDMTTRANVTAGKAGRYTFKVIVTDRETGETVSDSSSGITVTEAICQHANTKNEETGEVEYVKLSDSKHTVRIYMRKVCRDCNETLSKYCNENKTEEHSYRNGNCYHCGAAEPNQPCQHPEMTSSVKERNYVSGASAQTHTTVYTWLDHCAECSTLLNSTRETFETENHEFSGNVCTLCHYAKIEKCDHANKEKALLHEEVSKGNERAHVFINTYRVTCSDCGLVIDDACEEKDWQNHRVNNGKCSVCGYIAEKQPENTCQHTPVTTRGQSRVERNYVDDGNTHYLVTPLTITCECGQINRQEEERNAVAHVFDYTGYESAHKHQYFERCDCGVTKLIDRYKTANGKVQDKSECCICKGTHSFDTDNPRIENGEVHAYCHCGRYTVLKQADKNVESSVSDGHVHSYEKQVTTDKNHPHKVIKACACGEQKAFDAGQARYTNCCQCVGHDWQDPFRVSDGVYKQLCLRCNAGQVVEPPKNVEAFYDVMDIMKQDNAEAQKYQTTHDLDHRASSVWKTIASQAIDKLTDGGFVYTAEALDKYSDMSGAVVGVFTDKDWNEQQEKLWEELLIEMLTEQAQDFDAKNAFDYVSDGADKMSKAGEKVAESYKKYGENIQKTINEMDDWLLELEREANNMARNGNLDASNALRNKYVTLRKIKNDYDASLSNAKDVTKGGEQVEKTAKDVKFVMDVMGALGKVGERNESFDAMIAGGSANIETLDGIIGAAKATNNTELLHAAENLKKEIEAEMESEINRFFHETGSFCENFFNTDNIADMAADGIEEFVEKNAKSVLGAAAKDSLAILGGIELAAKGVKAVVNWNDAYDAANQLMLIRSLDTDMNILGALEYENSEDMAALWLTVQAKGSEDAKAFLNAWEKGRGLSVKEFGIKDGYLYYVMNQLDNDMVYYQDMAKEQKEKAASAPKSAPSLTLKVTANDCYLRYSWGSAKVGMTKGASVTITGYDAAADMFSAVYNGESGYVKGTGLSMTRYAIKQHFE